MVTSFFVLRCADIEDLAIANPATVLNDARNAVHRIVDIGVGAVVHAAIDQLDRSSIEKRIHKMTEDTRIACLLAWKLINARTDKVEGPDNRVV